MAAKQDIEIYQGDDAAWTVSVTNEDGSAADITGYTAQAQIRRAIADADPVVVVEMDAAVVSPVVHLSIPHTDTASLNGRYVWDLQLIGPTGGITTILAGKVILTQEVTRVSIHAPVGRGATRQRLT